MLADLIVQNTREVVTAVGARAPLAGEGMRELEVIADGAVASYQGVIVAAGPRSEVCGKVELAAGGRTIDAGGRVLVPGLVDPHTHLLFAGGREDEFLMRVAGEGYMEIGRKGGGIVRTVAATRATPRADLTRRGARHVAMMLRQGTTAVEIKSGYGLGTEPELEMLRSIRELQAGESTTIASTFLGAHALPTEYRDDPEGFIDLVVDEMLPAVHRENLADFCDVFCEDGAFTVEQSRRVLEGAAALGFRLKVHGNELAHSGGCRLAAELGALSVDHCNFLADDDLDAMRAAGTIAVGLPGTPFFRLAPRYADGRRIIDADVPLALATDYNPTASISSMLFVMFLACLEMKLDPVEALCGATINAAFAMGVADRVGSLEPGKSADFLLLDLEDFRHIPFYVGRDLIDLVVKAGRDVAGRRFAAAGPTP